jgi:hypothetical protein
MQEFLNASEHEYECRLKRFALHGVSPRHTGEHRRGWPLSADDWDTQMLFFLEHGYRVIAHDRRGHGRSTQTSNGNDMDTYAQDAAAVADALNPRDAIHIGHSTGGGEVAGRWRATWHGMAKAGWRRPSW